MLFLKREKIPQEQAMDGGAIIGQGHYGCVFDPPLLCEDAIEKKKSRQRVVGKLSDETDAKDEIIASKVLSEIANAKEYFVLADLGSYCDNIVPLEEQPDKKGIKMCEPIQYFGNKEMVHYTMPFGGISIIRYLETRNQPFPIRAMISHILEGAALMTLNGYIHYDIHLGNILIEGSKPRFIDFGQSFSSYNITQDTLDERWKVYKPSYPTEAPEVTVITGVRKWFSKFDTVVKQVVKEKPALKTAETILGLSRFKQLKDFVTFWQTSIDCKKKDWLGFFRLYWPAFDAWAIGVIVNYIYLKGQSIKNVTSDWRRLSGEIKELLKGLLRMDPRARLDCVEALHVFNPSSPVVSSASGKAWLQQRQAVRQLI
jgi:serine/threonine protein kinase